MLARRIKSPFPKAVYARNAEVYKILAHPTRLEILNTIRNREASVQDLIRILKLRKANVSQHLAILRQAHLVTPRRSGLNIFYKIVDPGIVEPCRVLKKLWEKDKSKLR